MGSQALWVTRALSLVQVAIVLCQVCGWGHRPWSWGLDRFQCWPNFIEYCFIMSTISVKEYALI